MSDFTSDFWSFYVAVLTIVSHRRLRRAALRDGPHARAQDAGEPPETTGHVWDEDLAEYNNPLPRWWMWLFYITIVFGLVYSCCTRASGSCRACSAGRSAAQLRRARRAGVDDDATARSTRSIAAHGRRRRSPTIPRRRRSAQRLFLNNCAQCHGSDARRQQGLSQPDRQRLAVRRRPGDDQGHDHRRPQRHDAAARRRRSAQRGRRRTSRTTCVASRARRTTRCRRSSASRMFMTNCAACHGADGKGNPALGAPNLTDEIWLHGGSQAAITETISKGAAIAGTSRACPRTRTCSTRRRSTC